MGGCDTFVAVPGRWRTPTCFEITGLQTDLRYGQVRVFRDCDAAPGEGLLGIFPRLTLAALRLELGEQVVRNSLQEAGLLVGGEKDRASGKVRIRNGEKEVKRVRLWVLRDSGPDPSSRRDQDEEVTGPSQDDLSG